MLVVFTYKGRNDKYLPRSVNKGYIIVPERRLVEDANLFILDDVTALGIEYPSCLVGLLEEFNQPIRLYDAQELAKKAVELLPITENITVIEGGGVLSYLFLKKAGYEGELKDTARIRRTYRWGIPFCDVERGIESDPDLIIEDIIASGQTLKSVLELEGKREVFCLLASSNIPKGGNEYRERQGSTLPGVRRLYCSQFVNGVSGKKPAILSLRYLLTKALDNDDYSTIYLARKFGGKERAREIVDAIKEVDREPIDFLRRDPTGFLRDYGVVYEINNF